MSPADAPRPPPPPEPKPPVVDARDLLAGSRLAIIRHGDQHYRLRVTASGKLILTK